MKVIDAFVRAMLCMAFGNIILAFTVPLPVFPLILLVGSAGCGLWYAVRTIQAARGYAKDTNRL